MPARTKRLSRLPSWLTPIDVAWAAGLIDGEGCLGIYNLGGRNRTPRATIRVAMTDRVAVERLREIFNAGTVTERPARGHRLPAFDWTVTAHREVGRTLHMLGPHLVVKREQAALLVAFLQSTDFGEKCALMQACSAAKSKPGHRRRAA